MLFAGGDSAATEQPSDESTIIGSPQSKAGGENAVTVDTMRKMMSEVTGAMQQLRTDLTEAVGDAVTNSSLQVINPALQPPPPPSTPIAADPIGALRETGGLATPSRGGGGSQWHFNADAGGYGDARRRYH